MPASDRAAFDQCSRRATALAGVASSIEPVKTDRASHSEAMKTKHEANPSHYWGTWYTLVQRAPARLKAYNTAAATLKSAPSCPGA